MPKFKVFKKNKNDYVLMIIAVLLLLLSAFFIFRFSPRRYQSQVPTPKIIGKAVLTVDFGNSKKRVFEGEIVEGEKLADALTQASKAGNFSYRLDGRNNLAAVDNFSAGKNKFWRWYLNDKKISAPNETFLKDGDKILVKYE